MRTLSVFSLLLVPVLAIASEQRDVPVVSIKTNASKALMESSLTVDVVSATMKATYHAHVEDCYVEVFGRAPSASEKGTMKLVFGVEPDGKTFAPVVTSFDKELDACVLEKVRTWTFPAPKDKANKPTTARFAYELALAPTKPLPRRTKMAKIDTRPVEMSEEDLARLANVLTAEGPTDRSGDMSARRPGGDLGRQLDEVTRSTGAGGRGDGATAIGGGSSTKVTKEPGPNGRISVTSSIAVDSTSLTPEVVLRKIQIAYMAGIKRCYKTQLKRDPTMRGKLRLAFTVNEVGRTTQATARSFDAALDTCVQALMASWRFPAPKDTDDDATEATFEYALSLVPD